MFLLVFYEYIMYSIYQVHHCLSLAVFLNPQLFETIETLSGRRSSFRANFCWCISLLLYWGILQVATLLYSIAQTSSGFMWALVYFDWQCKTSSPVQVCCIHNFLVGVTLETLSSLLSLHEEEMTTLRIFYANYSILRWFGAAICGLIY